MTHILIAGAGKVGCTAAHLFCKYTAHSVTLIDQFDRSLIGDHFGARFTYERLDVTQPGQLSQFINTHQVDAILCCLPFTLNAYILAAATENNIHYFDLTEDVQSANAVKQQSNNHTAAFVSQCGLAPGLVNMMAFALMAPFDQVHTVKLRCGGLPLRCNNALAYSFTWSIEGLINEYIKPCQAVVDGSQVQTAAMGDLETLYINGQRYEAFNTSGGIGDMPRQCAGRVSALDYKSIRYPGHCEKMKFLLHDLALNKQPQLLQQLLTAVIPHTQDDTVLLYVDVYGQNGARFEQKTMAAQFYSHKIDDQCYSALAFVTAASVAAVMDLVLQLPQQFQGFITQDRFTLPAVLATPIGSLLKEREYASNFDAK